MASREEGQEGSKGCGMELGLESVRNAMGEMGEDVLVPCSGREDRKTVTNKRQ